MKAKKETAIKNKMGLIALFFFNSRFLLISNIVFISRGLNGNKMTKLPEKAFLGLMHLSKL